MTNYPNQSNAGSSRNPASPPSSNSNASRMALHPPNGYNNQRNGSVPMTPKQVDLGSRGPSPNRNGSAHNQGPVNQRGNGRSGGPAAPYNPRRPINMNNSGRSGGANNGRRPGGSGGAGGPGGPRRPGGPTGPGSRSNGAGKPGSRVPRDKVALAKTIAFYAGICGILALCGIFALFGIAAYDLPEWDPEQLMGSNTSRILDAGGKEIAALKTTENRTQVTLDGVSSDLINAFIAVEDTDFYSHHGVNFKGILRAAVTNITSGDPTGQGASTITQQLARNAFLTQEKSWKRKLQEVLISVKLETTYSKDEILTFYLNKIYFGAGAYGVEAAAQTYFAKNASDLNLAESALIAGLAQSPSAYNPFENFDKARKRQRIVLDRMATCGFISQSQADNAYNQQLNFNKSFINGASYPHGFYVDAVINEAVQILGQDYDNPEQMIYQGGLVITTAMNPELQSHAEDIYANSDNFPYEDVESAMTIVDINTGEIKALMGGREYVQVRGFNRATSAHRQPGSSIKPISVYSPALERGLMPFYVLEDRPISIDLGGGETWEPKNYDYKYRGMLNMRAAVKDSVNTYAVQLLQEVGIQSSYSMVQSCGISLDDQGRDRALAPLALGGLTKGTNTTEMAGAYDALANGGLYSTPHLIRSIANSKGEIIYEYKDKPVPVMSETSAWLMTSMMKTVVESGTGTQARIDGIEVAGKTGTTEDLKDAWFCATTPSYACSVWMGHDSPQPMDDVYGGHYPAILCRSMLEKAYELEGGQSEFSKPGDIVEVNVCPLSGKKPGPTCQSEKEYCLSRYAPTATCDGIHTADYGSAVKICKSTGKLANQYCPDVEYWFKDDPTHTIPTEVCTEHTAANSGHKEDTKIPVRVVTKDPNYPGQRFLATPEAPRQYTEILMMTAAERDALPPYPGPPDSSSNNEPNQDNGSTNNSDSNNSSDNNTKPPDESGPLSNDKPPSRSGGP